LPFSLEYLEFLEHRKARPGEDPRMLQKRMAKDREFLGLLSRRWGKRRLDEIERRDIERFFREQSKRSNAMGNRALASIRACLNRAVRNGRMKENPAANVETNREPPARRRVLSKWELGRVLVAISRLEDDHVRVAFKVLVMTGCRLSELLSARWADLDLDAAQWHLPQTKAGEEQDIPLPDEVVEELRSLDRDGLYVIPGKLPGRPRESLKGPWARLKAAARVDPTIRLHDLRRGYGLAVARTHGLRMAQLLLRHSDIRVTEAHYAPEGFDTLKAATNAVVPFRRRSSSSG